MTTQTSICEKCGNEISRWDDGVCFHCLSKGDYKNLGGEWKIAPKKQLTKTNSIKKVDVNKITGVDWRVWLDALNSLLVDIYGKNMRFGQILSDHGISDDKITTWKYDTTWLIRFFNAFEKKLATIIINNFSEKEYAIFNMKYRINGKQASSTYEIAEKYGISEQEVIDIQQNLIQFFKVRYGKTKLETAILQSATLASDMNNIYK